MAGKRFHRLLLMFYPRSDRERYGDELADFWGRQSMEPRYVGMVGRLRLKMHLLRDGVVGGLRRRMRRHSAGPAGGRPGGSGTFGADVVWAVKAIRGAPVHASIVVLTLGLGIGATTAIFGVVDTVVLRPLPYRTADELVMISRADGDGSESVSWPDFRDWRAEAEGFAGMAAFCEVGADFGWTDGAEHISGAGVTRDLFGVLGASPLLGRSFTADEDRAGGPDAVLLSWDLWQRRFGGDATAIDRVIEMDGEQVRVVGVMPRGFTFPTKAEQYWQALQEDELLRRAGLPAADRDLVFLSVVGRLDGRIERARARLTTLAARIDGEAGVEPADRLPVVVEPLRDAMVGDVKLTLFMLLGAVSLVLLVTCANVAGLTLSRTAARSLELALRIALGAGRSRLVRQLLTESVLLSLLAGVLGVGFAVGLTRVIVAVAPAGVPRLDEIGIGWSTLAFAVVLAAVCGVAFGTVPAVRSTAGRITDGLARRGRGALTDRRALRPQQILVTFQVALGVVLLTGAVLLVRSYEKLTSIEPGFTTDGLVVASIMPPDDRYDEPEPVEAFYSALLERIRALPGVRAATSTYSPPLMDNGFRTTIEVEGGPADSDSPVWAGSVIVRDDYFRTTGTPLLRGRDFSAADRLGGAPVAIVSRTMQERLWPGRSAIGKRFRLAGGFMGSAGRFDRRFFPAGWFTVVGVAGDVRREGLDLVPEPEYYRPHAQIGWSHEFVMIRTDGDVPAMVGRVRDIVHRLDPAVPVGSVRTMRATVRDAAAEWRFRMMLLASFGAVTCLLAMLGVYALMALAVAARRKEMGVRLALGATTAGLQLQVLRRGLSLVAAGTAAGLAVSVPGSRLLESMLFGITRSDPVTYAAVTFVTVAVALFACWSPARRASRVDPARSLQQE